MPHRQPTTLRVPVALRQRSRVMVLLAVVSSLLALAVRADVADAAATTYSIWPSSVVPAVAADPDRASVELGVVFRSDTDGWLTGIRYYKSTLNTGPHTGTLWSAGGQTLARVTFTAESASGWQLASLSTPVKVVRGSVYVASYRSPKGAYAADVNALSPAKPQVTNALTATQGVYTYGSGMPTSVWKDSNYYVDVVFSTVAPSSPPPTTATTSTAPSFTTTAPAPPSTTSRPPTSTSPTSTTTTPSSTSTTPTSTSTTPATPATGVCATSQVWSNLVACGWPGAGSTGYPTGQTFATTVTGGLVVTTDNTIIDGWKVNGGIQVRAKNVTIRNSWVTSSFGGASGSGTININPGASATVEHNLVDGLNATHACVWHEGSSATIRANNCQGVNDGIFMWATTPGVDGSGDNFTIEDNWLHGFTTQAANGHIDGIQTEGAKNGVIRHNTIDVTQDQDSAIALWNGRKSTDNIRVESNLLAGGGFAVYAEDYSPSESNPAGGYTLTNVTFTGNVFSTVHFSCVGYWGVWFARGAPSDGWRRAGNVVLETGQHIDAGNPSAGGRVCS